MSSPLLLSLHLISLSVPLRFSQPSQYPGVSNSMASDLRMHPTLMISGRVTAAAGLSRSSLLRWVPRPPERPLLPFRLPSQHTDW